MPKPPPGVDVADFQKALRQFEQIVGKEWVFSSDEDVALYRDAYSPLRDEADERVASAAVAPTSVEEIQSIVKVAREHSLPLYTISTGRNLTYGGSAPTYSGSVVLDLKRMNRILEVSERDKTCLVEPGVSYFDLYRHFQTNKLKLWIDTADPGWGGLIGNALDHGCGYTGPDVRDHFDAHCGMEVVLANGEVVRTGMGANSKAKTWQIFKYGMGPWVDGIFSQSNFGIVTKMGFWLMEQPASALQVRVSVPNRADIIPLLDTLTSLMYSHVISSEAQIVSPIMDGSADAELVRLRLKGSGASDADWARYAQRRGQPFWTVPFCFYGPPKIVAAAWEHTKDRLAAIPGVTFAETASLQFPLSEEQVGTVADKMRFGIPSLDLFRSRSSTTDRPNEGHMDFSPICAPHGEDLLAMTDLTAKVYADANMTPTAVIGFLFHPRALTVFHTVPTYRNAADNKRSRDLFRQLVQICGDRGWSEYRIHPYFQALGIKTYDFNNGALHRLHETLKDAMDPEGILSPGRYDIWPKHLRGTRT